MKMICKRCGCVVSKNSFFRHVLRDRCLKHRRVS